MQNETNLNELYRSLTPAIREELSRLEEQAIVPAGTKLISHTAIPGYLIVIEQGSVEISVPAGERTVSLSVAGRGKVLGLRPVVAKVLPEIDATTLEQCTIRRIAGDTFLELLRQHPEMYVAISKILSTDLNEAERLLRDLPRAAGKDKRPTHLNC